MAAVLDLYSRRIVGWSMQTRMTQDVVLDAVAMALRDRHPQAGLLHRTDRGSQYVSEVYQALLERYGISCGMSRS